VQEPLFRFRSVTLGYGKRIVLEDVTFDVSPGDFFGIIGPNGAGKTTILRAMLGLLRPRAGSVAKKDGLRYGYVMQRQMLDTLFPFTVEDVAAMGRLRGFGPPGRGRRPRDDRPVSEAMEIAGVNRLCGHLYRELSGGQKQRVLLARALACEPDVLILDEPTNDMDIQGEEQIMNLLRRLQHDRGLTVVLVSHLLHVVLNFTDRIAFLVDGRAHVHAVGDLASGEELSRIYGVRVTVGKSHGKRYLVTGEG